MQLVCKHSDENTLVITLNRMFWLYMRGFAKCAQTGLLDVTVSLA